ncbi:MAG: hypothetical protein AAGI88_13755 [Pseudomonadota bacterium]
MELARNKQELPLDPKYPFLLGRLGFGLVAFTFLLSELKIGGWVWLGVLMLYVASTSYELSGRGSIEEWGMMERVITSLLGVLCIGFSVISVLSW